MLYFSSKEGHLLIHHRRSRNRCTTGGSVKKLRLHTANS
jgi:hypothetical protein